MRACSWTLVAVLAVGLGLQSSGSAAENPGGSEPAEAIAFALEGSQCQAPAPALSFEPVQPMFLSCSAQAVCGDGSTVACSVPSGTCTGVDASCPDVDGYVQCGSTFISCIDCDDIPPTPGPDCVQSCSVDSDCTSHCAGPGICSSSCTSKPYIKKCVCIA